MRKRIGRVLLLLLVSIPGLHAAPQASDYAKAQTLMVKGAFQEAINLMEPLFNTNENYQLDTALGDAYAGLNAPASALIYYNAAYQFAIKRDNATYRRVALFRIGRTQLWLKQYTEAIVTYQSLLTLPLAPVDKEIAEAGFTSASQLQRQAIINKARAYIESNEGQQAYDLIKEDLEHEKRADLYIIAAQSMAIMEDPNQSLSFFEQARAVSQNPEDTKIALFGVVKTQLWLHALEDAQQTLHVLETLALSADEYKQWQQVASELKAARIARLNDALQKARRCVQLNQGHRAYALIKHYAQTEKDTRVFIIAAQSMAILERPKDALFYYEQALKSSKNSTEKTAAWFGMVKIQLWLNDTHAAQNTLTLLRALHLSAADKTRLQALSQERAKLVYDLTLDHDMQQADELIQRNEGDHAYTLIKAYLIKEKSAALFMLAADSMASMDDPLKALDFYQEAYRFSHNPVSKKLALFGVAKMQFWLGYYVRAKDTYARLLHEHLSAREHELALAGLVKSLAYYNRPRSAYHAIPKSHVYTTKELVIAASQASLWANWADITKETLLQYQTITKDINPESALGRDLQDLQWQTDQATWPDIVTPGYFYSLDSEYFNKQRSTVDYTHYWSQLAQTSVGLDYTKYAQNYPFQLNARGVYVGQTLRPTRSLILKGQLEPTEFKNLTPNTRPNWNPFLWSTSINYAPNDYISMQVLALKEIIETFPAFNHQISDNQYAASITLNPLPYVQVNGACSRLEISDSNIRNGYYVSSSVLVVPSLGLSAVGSLRNFNDKFTSRYYFSPANYTERKMLLRLGRKLGATWHYYLDAGIGRQFILPQFSTEANASPTYQWGFGFSGPLTHRIFLTAYYADLHQASAFISSPTYHYQYGAVSVNVLM